MLTAGQPGPASWGAGRGSATPCGTQEASPRRCNLKFPFVLCVCVCVFKPLGIRIESTNSLEEIFHIFGELKESTMEGLSKHPPSTRSPMELFMCLLQTTPVYSVGAQTIQ